MGSILFSHWAILGMEITNNGILMTSDYQGRSSGEAYVQFSSKQDGEKALEKNKQSIGHRLVWLGMGPLAIDIPGYFRKGWIGLEPGTSLNLATLQYYSH